MSQKSNKLDAKSNIVRQVEIEAELSKRKARKSFWHYCQLLFPEFYTDDKTYLRELCDYLQAFHEDKLYNANGEQAKLLMINIPPRHGKTLTLEFFESWVLGKSPGKKFISCSYNVDLSTMFSKKIRNAISSSSVDPRYTSPRDVFPDLKLKDGESSATVWTIDHPDAYVTHLASSPGAAITGFGADYGIIDDLIKNGAEAKNDIALNKHWEWFTDTFLSRIENGGKILLIMTRWSNEDLCGKILKSNLTGVYQVIFKAVNEKTGKMLCDSVLSKEGYEYKQSITSFEIMRANYQQDPRNFGDVLYPDFNTYNVIPESYKAVTKAYVDIADEGKDYFCAAVYTEVIDTAYIKDIIYTQERLEKTEQYLLKSCIKNKVKVCYIEGNNGGLTVARNMKNLVNEHNRKVTEEIERIDSLEEFDEDKKSEKISELETLYCKVIFQPFKQTLQKKSRIHANAFNVVKNIIMPINWKQRFKDFAIAILKYSRTGKNKHDDAPDVLTGVYEKLQTAVVKIRSVN